MTKQTGGPAFPCDLSMYDKEVVDAFQGATLRDYFAAKALPQIVRYCLVDFYKSNPNEIETGVEDDAKIIAIYSYQIADAMLEARK